ncbi:MAG: glycosyltransferase family 4 protein [Candidatus Hodarchaeota archaeon]
MSRHYPIKICIFTSDLLEPFDEGVKKFANSVTQELAKTHLAKGLCLTGTQSYPVKNTCANRLLLSTTLRREIQGFDPDAILYFPNASANIFSLWRSRLLKFYAKKAKVVMVALQFQEHGSISKKIMPLLMPDLIFVQSKKAHNNLSRLRARVRIMPSAVNAQKFVPVKEEVKRSLRHKYGLDESAYIILHVGHISANRNLQALKKVQTDNRQQVLLVASTSTGQDLRLVNDLQFQGIKIIREYLPQIEQVYQLSDCYLFPVHCWSASIEMPFSVLEAMACNLPVVTTRFGAIPDLFTEKNGIFLVDGDEEFQEKIQSAKNTVPKTRVLAKQFSWQKITYKLLTNIEEII